MSDERTRPELEFIGNVADLATALGLGSGDFRAKDFAGDRVVSTCVPSDLECYETAVAVIGWLWHPVERYETEQAAREGHQRWLTKLPELTVITDIGLPGVVEPKEITLGEGE